MRSSVEKSAPPGPLGMLVEPTYVHAPSSESSSSEPPLPMGAFVAVTLAALLVLLAFAATRVLVTETPVECARAEDDAATSPSSPIRDDPSSTDSRLSSTWRSCASASRRRCSRRWTFSRRRDVARGATGLDVKLMVDRGEEATARRTMRVVAVVVGVASAAWTACMPLMSLQASLPHQRLHAARAQVLDVRIVCVDLARKDEADGDDAQAAQGVEGEEEDTGLGELHGRGEVGIEGCGASNEGIESAGDVE